MVKYSKWLVTNIGFGFRVVIMSGSILTTQQAADVSDMPVSATVASAQGGLLDQEACRIGGCIGKVKIQTSS